MIKVSKPHNRTKTEGRCFDAMVATGECLWGFGSGTIFQDARACFKGDVSSDIGLFSADMNCYVVKSWT